MDDVPDTDDVTTNESPSNGFSAASAIKAFMMDGFDNAVTGFMKGDVIIRQSRLEEAVRRCLATAFRGSDKETTELIGGDERPGIMSYSDQCRLAHCMGIVGPSTLADLKTLGKIRNRIAHGGDPNVAGLEDQRSKDLCASLRIIDRLEEIENAEAILKTRHLRIWQFMEHREDAKWRHSMATMVIEALLPVEAERWKSASDSAPCFLT
jgi:hypothetical protein